MDNDLIQFLAGVGVMISLFTLISLLIRFLQRKLSRWVELSELFPSRGIPAETEFYRCPGKAGRFSFSNRNSRGLSAGFTREGIRIRMGSIKSKELLVPWHKIQSATKYAQGLRTAAKVILDSKIPLILYLTEEALSVFERWHHLEPEPVERFPDDRSLR